MMSFDDVPVLFYIFGDSRDGSGFFVIDGFIEHGEGVFNFWMGSGVQRRRV